jgi:hypothetical protein
MSELDEQHQLTCRFLLSGDLPCPNSRESHSHFCSDHSKWFFGEPEIYQAVTDQYKLIAEHYRNELQLFWTRANFYFLVQGALLSAFAALVGGVFGKENPTDDPIRVIFWIGLIMCSAGILLAVCWLVVMYGGQHWIEQWRKQVVKAEKVTPVFRAFEEIEVDERERLHLLPKHHDREREIGGTKEREKSILFCRLKSPMRVTRLLPMLFTLAWLCILAWLLVSFF